MSIRVASVNLWGIGAPDMRLDSAAAFRGKNVPERAFAIADEHVKGPDMASDAMMQAIGRLERALTRAETLAKQVAENHAEAIEAQLANEEALDTPGSSVEIDPFSRDKAIAALKSLDALIGDLQKARSEA